MVVLHHTEELEEILFRANVFQSRSIKFIQMKLFLLSMSHNFDFGLPLLSSYMALSVRTPWSVSDREMNPHKVKIIEGS